MLHPSLESASALAALRSQWQTTGSLRIAPFLADDAADAIATALRSQVHALDSRPDPGFGYLYWKLPWQPDPACEHLLCELGRWLFGDGAAWLSELTRMSLGPPPDRMLIATLYTKGSYLDAHNDYDGERQVAYVLGLTRDLPFDDRGGALEFLEVQGDQVRVSERRPPAWNALDLFDVSKPVRMHRVPILTGRAERRAISGWLHKGSVATPG